MAAKVAPSKRLKRFNTSMRHLYTATSSKEYLANSKKTDSTVVLRSGLRPKDVPDRRYYAFSSRATYQETLRLSRREL